jgi:hypothetical protein
MALCFQVPIFVILLKPSTKLWDEQGRSELVHTHFSDENTDSCGQCLSKTQDPQVAELGLKPRFSDPPGNGLSLDPPALFSPVALPHSVSVTLWALL